LKRIRFKFRVDYDAEAGGKVLLNENNVETVCILGNTNRKPDDVIKVTVDVDKMHEILDKEKAEREMKESSE
jgi:hypothetical protein